MATVTRGFTYPVNGTVTNTNLHTLVDAATVSQIVSADFNLATTNPIHVGSSPPSDANQRFWYDTANNLYKVKDSANKFQPVAHGQIYTNKSGASLDAGDVVVLDTANAQAVKTTTSSNDLDAWGVSAETISNDAAGVIITSGFVPSLKVTGSTAIGDFLFTSTTVKKADPSSSISAGAFARALTSSSSAVVAEIFSGGAAQAIPGSDTFEFESDRESTVSTTFGSPTTVTFATAFTEPPVVVAVAENTTVSAMMVLDVTTTNFTVMGQGTTAFNWFACTAGTFEVSSGVIIQSGTGGNSAATDGQISTYQTGKTPAVCLGNMSTDDSAPSTNIFGNRSRLWGSTTTNINFAGRGLSHEIVGAGRTGNTPSMVLVSQTSTTKVGSSVTADGTQGSIDSRLFECGAVLNTNSATPSLTFATAFSAAPMVIVTIDIRNPATAAASAILNAVPTTTAFTVRMSAASTDFGYSWIAFEKGHGSITTAKRV